MNAPELNIELNKLLTTAITKGVAGGKMDFWQIIGLLEQHKAQVQMTQQNIERRLMAEQAAHAIIPANGASLPRIVK